MIDILFRGKQKDLDIWVEGQYYKQKEYYGYPCVREYIITSTESLDYDLALEYCAVRPETIGRYTGLADKNGNKIFEGDIVKTRHWPGVIEWDRHNASFIVHCVGRVETRNSLVGHKKLEVIGNVHDNPGLLPVDKSVSLIDGHID